MNTETFETEEEGFQRGGFSKNIFLTSSYDYPTNRSYDEQEEWVSVKKYEHLESKLKAAEDRLASLDYKNPNSYKFRFHIGQPVWHIQQERIARYKECLSCEKGKINLKDGTSLECPSCKGRALQNDGYVFKWEVGRQLTIGQLRLEFDPDKLEEQYMCRETGVGSGNVYYAQRLFPTREAASEECVKRNANLIEYRCAKCEAEKTGKNENYFSSFRHTREWLECSKHSSSLHYRYVNGAFDENYTPEEGK